MENAYTYQDWLDKVTSFKKALTKTYGVRFSGEPRTGALTFHHQFARLGIDQLESHTDKKTGKALTQEALQKLAEEHELKADIRMTFGTCAVFFYPDPTNYVKVVWRQFVDNEPEKLYVWHQKGNDIYVTREPKFDTVQLDKISTDVGIFDTYEEAVESLRYMMEHMADSLRRQIKAATAQLEVYEERLRNLR